MIVEYVRYELKSHSPDDLIAAYAEAGAHLRAAPECLGYEFTQCEEVPSSLILRVQWRSTSEHVQVFRTGPHFPPFLALVRPFAGEIAEMRHYRATDVRWARANA